MAVQLSTSARNARLDAIETTVGVSPKLQIRSGSPPANCATADSGTLLCEMTLPSNWLADAASGQKALAGSWTGTGQNGPGTAGHFRIKDSGGTTCHMQGTVGTSGADMIVDNASINTGQTVNVTAFTLTDGNA